jgi:hypothetical protein
MSATGGAPGQTVPAGGGHPVAGVQTGPTGGGHPVAGGQTGPTGGGHPVAGGQTGPAGGGHPVAGGQTGPGGPAGGQTGPTGGGQPLPGQQGTVRSPPQAQPSGYIFVEKTIFDYQIHMYILRHIQYNTYSNYTYQGFVIFLNYKRKKNHHYKTEFDLKLEKIKYCFLSSKARCSYPSSRFYN